MDLYCDGPPDCKNRVCRPAGDELVPPAQYTGNGLKECKSQAKKRGWKLDFKRGTALCPACARAGFEPTGDLAE